MVFAWTQIFADYQNVSYRSASILKANVDAVVSPANSFGFMDGGIDLAYRSFFGLRIQRRVQQVIRDRYGEELPVGRAFVVPTGHDRITRMVIAPTMRTPQNIQGTDNVYLATRAALLAASEAAPAIERLGIPGMGTGIGGMDPFESAQQMLRAAVEVLNLPKRPDEDQPRNGGSGFRAMLPTGSRATIAMPATIRTTAQSAW